MFSIFKADPIKRLNKQYYAKLEEAMLAQRNGNIRGYSELSEQAEQIRQQLTQLQAAQDNKS